MAIGEFFRVLTEVPALLKLKRESKARPLEVKDSVLQYVEANAKSFADRDAAIFEGRSLTWRELNDLSNQYGWTLKDSGLAPGEVVSLFMENRIEFLIAILAIMKVGGIAALINTNLTGETLRHCITVTESKLCLFGTELSEAIDGVRNDVNLGSEPGYLAVRDLPEHTVPAWAADAEKLSHNQSSDRHEETDEITLGDTAMYIFTSGTTGLPKAAVMGHQRLIQSSKLSHIAGLKCSEKDRIYLCLPLYHGTGGVVGVGAAFCSGAAVYLRRKFSVSQFLPDIREQNITCMIYVGELLRYLVNSPRKSDDADTPLTRMMGNGLRPDIWMEFKERFGIDRICEFYGASEGNVAFGNVLNKDETIGTTTASVALVKYDVAEDEILRSNEGYCERVDQGEPGLCLGKITTDSRFEGYTDTGATEKKILRDVFEAGDAWFNTGDLLRAVDVGFSLGFVHYQFVDRVGDTFRWRSENVSTNEVGEIINAYPQVEICNVYGVDIENTEGRAGMVAIVLREGEQDLDVEAFGTYVNEKLPHFARPVFVRVRQDIDVTGTFKMIKKELVSEHFDSSQFNDTVYVMKPRTSTYEVLDDTFLEELKAGSAGY